MKRTFVILSGLICMIFTACCPPPDPIDINQTADIKVTATVFAAAGGTKEIISSNLELELISVPEWLSFSQKKVDGRFVYEATCAANESTTARQASITYRCEEKKTDSIKQEVKGTIPVTQLGKAG